MVRALFLFVRKEALVMEVKEIIVVEGKADSVKIKQAVLADTIETNGSAINKPILEQIRHAKEKRGIIIFTDPDYPGQRIRAIIDEAVPGCKHAFIDRDKAKAASLRHKSLGIEHASIKHIKLALADVYELRDPVYSDINESDLIKYGLIGIKGSKGKREKLGNILRIGYTNGKQLLKRLTMFQITKEHLKNAMKQLKMEESNGAK